MEHEFRDAEMALTLAEVRSDVDKLVTKLSVKEATEAADAGESVALLGGGDATSSRTHADMMLMKVTGKITIGRKKKKRKEPPMQLVRTGLTRSGKIVLDALGPLRPSDLSHCSLVRCELSGVSSDSQFCETKKVKALLGMRDVRVSSSSMPLLRRSSCAST